MDFSDFPPNVQKFIEEMISRGSASRDVLMDKTFINYLYSQKYDKDYIDSRGLGSDPDKK